MKQEDFIRQMTRREKTEATVMKDGRCFVTERLHNRGFLIKDNPRGDEDYAVEDPKDRKPGDYYPVAWPQAAAQAASFAQDVAYEIGKAMGRECRKRDINVLLRPGVNIKRSPLCGRNFEYYSEDPVLAGKLGGAFIRGTQSEGTAANLKHFAVNSQEFERMTTNAVVSMRALREIYLKPFEIAIREGKPWTVMTSYNKVNGQWVPANEELMKLLREEFGFDGVVISDAMAIQTEKVLSHKFGLDFEIGAAGLHTRELQDAIERGILDESIEKMLLLQEKTGNRGEKRTDCEAADHARARELAAECMVLLKNDGVLPLKKGGRVAVIGRLAKEPNYMGCGSGHMNGWKIDSTYEELCALLGEETEISYADGYRIVDRVHKEQGPDETLIAEAVSAAKEADVVLFFTGLPIGYESEGYDRQTLSLPADMEAALRAVLEAVDGMAHDVACGAAQGTTHDMADGTAHDVACGAGKKVIVVNVSGAPVDLTLAKERAAAILHSYLAGEALGGALADVLCGVAEPGGRLPETFPLRLSDTPSYMSFPTYPTVMPDVHYGEDIFVGYRWYEKRQIPVLFPFGSGLSYTTFAFSDAAMGQASYAADEPVTATVSVKNTGSRRGSQVIQMYVRKPDSGYVVSEKELKAFAKVTLDPGEEQTMTFSASPEDLGFYDEVRGRFVRESGRYEVILATGSAETDIIEKLSFDVKDGERAQTYHRLLAAEWFRKHSEIGEIAGSVSDRAKEAFAGNQDDTLGDLINAMPAYRMTEDSLFGEPAMRPDELAQVLDLLNREGSQTV